MTEHDAEAANLRESDILTGPLPRVIFVLALPVLLENFLGFLVGFYDVFLAGKLSEHATKAIGVASYVGWLASLIFGLVGAGTTALVSRHYGARKFADANRFLNRSLALSTVMGVGIAILFWLIAPLFARLVNMRGEAYEIAVRYLRYDAFGHFFLGFTYIAASALRGSGNMRLPMYVLGFMNLVNIIVSAILVFGIGTNVGLGSEWIASRGVDGIVMGTVAAKICGASIMLICLLRGSGHLKIDFSEFRLRDELVARILRIGRLALLDGSIVWVGQFLFLMIISQLESSDTESTVFAAHVVGINVEAISFLPAFAWGIAASTAIGQSLGAGLPDRALQAGKTALKQCSIFMLFLTFVFFFGAETIYQFMSDQPRVHEVGVPAFRLLALFQLPLAMSIIFSNSLRGAGDTRHPMIFSFIGVILVRLPLAYLGGVVLDGGLIGAWVGMCADVLVKAILVSVYYLRGKWVETSV
ncbi:MAG TPA: MATE family efflux transporter [Planctomycetaceae bacterium]|nr:MATE family efflux transporter [Planctomycetaceae bacterium]